MNDSLRTLRRLIWLYFWLLLFEGALRKWLVPGLSNALLIVRDPVALAIYVAAFRQGVFPRVAFVSWSCLLAALCFLASFAGEGNWKVSLYGLRTDFLHLPLIVLLPRVLREEDVRRLGGALLVLLPAMALLAVAQFQGGPDSRWNVGAGGEIGGQLYAAEGKVRASGTFSFTTGISTYLALCAAFLLQDFLARRIYPRWLIFAAVPSLILAIVVSGSRTAVISVSIVCATVLYMGLRRPADFGAAVRPVLAGLAAIVLLAWLTPVFDEGLAVHRQRFESGGGLKEGIFIRYGNEFVSAWQALFYVPPLGIGLGVGTNVGATLLRGQRQFLLGEGELQRVITESGPILGLSYIALRCTALVMILRAALASYRVGRSLPLLLVAASGLELVTGQFGQPTTLGFAVFVAGMALAAASPAASEAVEESSPEPAPPKIRGRSAYAARLHGEGESS